MADILFVTMETRLWLKKVNFLLNKTHSILLAENIARFAQIKKLSYLPAVCGLKSPGIAGRLLESYKISCSLRRENISPGFLMKTKIFLCGLTKDRQSLPLLTPTTTAWVTSIEFCAKWTRESKLSSILMLCLLLKLFIRVRRTVPHYRPHVHIKFKYWPSIHLQYIQILFHSYILDNCHNWSTL